MCGEYFQLSHSRPAVEWGDGEGVLSNVYHRPPSEAWQCQYRRQLAVSVALGFSQSRPPASLSQITHRIIELKSSGFKFNQFITNGWIILTDDVISGLYLSLQPPPQTLDFRVEMKF